MRHDIVEIVASNEYASQLVTAVAQSAYFYSHLSSVEIDLSSYPSESRTIGDARIFVQVESLMQSVLENSGRRESMETIYHQNGLLCLGIVECREYFCGEALSATVAGSNLEVVKDAWLKL